MTTTAPIAKQLSETTGLEVEVVEAYLATIEDADSPVEPTVEGLWRFDDYLRSFTDEVDIDAVLAERLELHILAEEARFHARQ